jgi:hypothetical protein
MFENNFNAEESIKKWAQIIANSGAVWLILCVLAGIIILCLDEYLWWVSLIVLADGILTVILANFFAVMVWGFGDVVGNTKRLSYGAEPAPVVQQDEPELPEL